MIVKVQYKEFEPGEFTDIADRSFEETIALIDKFPWEEQRENLRIGLTTPSVAMEGAGGEFLKLALYYNGKFVMYYIDTHHHEFSRVLMNFSEAADSIQAFFKDYTEPPVNFVRQPTPLQNVIIHFKSGNFTYTIRSASVAGMIAFICLMLAIAVTWTIAAMHIPILAITVFFLIGGIAILLFAIMQLRVLVNHYRYASGKVLILSRGLREFTFGPAGNPATFNKNDIQQIITHGMQGRGGYPATARVEIIFKGGTSLNLSCLMLSQETMTLKFPSCNQTMDKVMFPFIPSSASSPS